MTGASHGPEVGVVIEGVPKGTRIEITRVQEALDRRRPVGRRLATKRQEHDRLRLESGVESDHATGEPIRAHVQNEDVRRSEYERYRTVPRPGHADYPARIRLGPEADLSGGGIFSGRMTVPLVIAGSVAAQLLVPQGIEIAAFTQRIGDVAVVVPDSKRPEEIRSAAMTHEIGCPDAAIAKKMAGEISSARRAGDSVGGIVECRVHGLPVGLGEPFFDSIESEVAHLAFSIPAVKGIEFGAGFRAAEMRGSEHNDPFFWDGERIATRTNRAGGVLGGLATGMPLTFRVAFKPTASIARPQESVDLLTHAPVQLVVVGRHDPCIVPRAVVVVEAIAAIAVADLGLAGGFVE
ncbi:MAG: chorismate synthase [Thermoplasmata archaeon]|nr:chorismate synthase [Thermoplasmata archaeon]